MTLGLPEVEISESILRRLRRRQIGRPTRQIRESSSSSRHSTPGHPAKGINLDVDESEVRTRLRGRNDQPRLRVRQFDEADLHQRPLQRYPLRRFSLGFVRGQLQPPQHPRRQSYKRNLSVLKRIILL